MIKRYQECNLIVKLWRHRYYILIPFLAAIMWAEEAEESEESEEINVKFPMRFQDYLKLAKAIAQIDMHWYYTKEEVSETLKLPKDT